MHSERILINIHKYVLNVYVNIFIDTSRLWKITDKLWPEYNIAYKIK